MPHPKTVEESEEELGFHFPDQLTEKEIDGILTTIAISKQSETDSSPAPLLDALTTYREEHMN